VLAQYLEALKSLHEDNVVYSRSEGSWQWLDGAGKETKIKTYTPGGPEE